MLAETPDSCVHCGTDIPPRADACPECDADEENCWRDHYSGDLGLPDDDFDYDEFVEREFGAGKSPKIIPQGLHWFWWLISIALIAALVLMWA